MPHAPQVQTLREWPLVAKKGLKWRGAMGGTSQPKRILPRYSLNPGPAYHSTATEDGHTSSKPCSMFNAVYVVTLRCCRPCHSSLCSTHECTCVTRERRTRDSLAASLFAQYTMTTPDRSSPQESIGDGCDQPVPACFRFLSSSPAVYSCGGYVG